MPLPGEPVRILLKTTIGESKDDWCMGRFSLLARHLASLAAPDGRKLYEVVSANRRETAAGDDADLADLAQGRNDELWLIAADVTGALTAADAANIQAFRAKGGGVYLTRDHQDLGACLTKLGALEPSGEEVLRDPHALDDVHAYVANVAAWLAPRI